MSDDEQEERNGQPAKSASGKIKGVRGRNERVVAPEEVRAHLRRLYANEAVMCSLLFGRHGPFAKLTKEGYSLASADMFFVEVIPVTPTRFRPPAKLGDTLFEHPQNELLDKAAEHFVSVARSEYGTQCRFCEECRVRRGRQAVGPAEPPEHSRSAPDRREQLDR
jgi:hypothetical protein